MASGVFVALAVVGMLVYAGLVTIILSQQSTPAGGSNSATNTGSTPIPTPPEPASTVAPVSGDNAIGLDLGNGVTMEFVRIPAGSFTMGSPKAEQDEFARCAKRDGFSFTITNEDEHPVRISKDFLLGKYPVTQAQYEAIVGSNPSMFKDVPGEDTRLFPVEDVSWEDATAFCDKLSGRTGKKVTLPTEAEWEYACRGGTKTTFYFGETLDGTQANCDGSKPFGTDAKAPYLHRTSRVGAYAGVAPHPLGLCDMHGNVWQWCRDWYDEGYYKRSPNVDPFCNEGEQKYRLLRGGSWRQPAWGCRAAVRRRTAPGDRNGGYGNVGFRVEFRLD
jgi:formylglycine-generating enzyme required for sulfatase activity